MAEPASINPQIIEGLYCEALVLADEVRDAFAVNGRIDSVSELEDLARIALSCEGMRTTTRMMHAIAWLLNHRAFFMGELTEFQLRRSGRLSPDLAGSDADSLAMLPGHMRALVEETDQFYARLIRLDSQWRLTHLNTPNAVARLRERIGHRSRV